MLDNLTEEQELRLNCLLQANQSNLLGTSPEEIIKKAKKFEEYIKGEK